MFILLSKYFLERIFFRKIDTTPLEDNDFIYNGKVFRLSEAPFLLTKDTSLPDERWSSKKTSCPELNVKFTYSLSNETHISLGRGPREGAADISQKVLRILDIISHAIFLGKVL